MLPHIQIHTSPYTMTHMNPHTQPKHTRRIPSADFPLSLPLLLAGTTCQGVFSGEVHALQLTQGQGLISYLSDLQSQDQVLFPHPPSFASYPRKVCSFFSQRLWSFLLLWGPLCHPLGQYLPFVPHPSRVRILSEEKLPLNLPWHKAAPGPPRSPGALEGRQRPSSCSELCRRHGESRPVRSSHGCPFAAG